MCFLLLHGGSHHSLIEPVGIQNIAHLQGYMTVQLHYTKLAVFVNIG